MPTIVARRIAGKACVDPARLRRLAAEIHTLGERALYELFRELAAGADLVERLERYAALSPLVSFIRQLDGDQLHGPRVIRGGRS
jgi:hypothetical protein